ncbi:MAG: tetratricopeptide repeat protein [Prolixibacteraceae bacterium]
MMWEESRDNFESKEFANVLKRYKQMLTEQRTEFFDVADFEFIADQYIDKSQFSNALQACEIALRQHPNSIIVKIKKAQIYLSQLKLQKAIHLLKQLEEIENTNPDVMMMLGTCHNMKGEYHRANEYFKKAELFAFEDRDELLYNIGISFIQTGAYDEALTYLKKALDENPGHEPVLYDIAFCYEKVGDDTQAIDFYNKYLDIDPFSESAWYNLGIIYNRQEDFVRAIDAYDFALAIDSNYSAAIFNKANALSAIERFKDSVEAYHDYLRIDPDSVDAHLYLADCFFQMDDYENAELYYDKTIGMEPNCSDGWFGAGLVMLINDRAADALPLLSKSLEINTDCAECWNALGKAHAAMGNFTEARTAYRKALELDNEIAEYWLSYADLLFKNNLFEEAVKILEEAENTEAYCAAILFRQAGFYIFMDNFDLAKEKLECALAEDFSAHIDFLENFPTFLLLEWVTELIKKYNRPYEEN